MDAVAERAYQKLEANLEELTKIYRQLLDAVRKEKEILVRADREALEESNLLKEELLYKLRAQDSLRSRYAMDLATIVGADIENPRLLELAQKLAGTPAADRLRTQHAALDNIKEALSGKKTYESKGKYKQGPQVSGNFVSKEA